ncbi:MAG: hypothetical protein NC900_05530 [Candidatus Omnitrophica bacterium]|nr:hypothetical protein [Candidatus Omnitrophota bacterium]
MKKLSLRLKERKGYLGLLLIRGQVTLELTVALIVTILFLIGITKIFVWLNQTMVERQQAYQDTRPKTTAGVTKDKINFYTPKKLDIFGEESE